MTDHHFPARSSWLGLVLVTLSAAQVFAQAGEDVRDLSPFRACGLNCLFVTAKLDGLAVSLDGLRAALAPGEDGESSIADIERAANAVGMYPVSIQADMASLADVPLPAIVHLKSRPLQSSASHYVVLAGFHHQGVMTIDPPNGLTIHPYEEFAREWTGAAVAFAADRQKQGEMARRLETPNDPSPRLKVWAVVASVSFAAVILLVGRRRRGNRVGSDPNP